MTPEQLKSSILQYAIQGKLVEQRPEEGTAEELYRQIQDEKQRLIKEGKIKKEKPLAEISEDEIPFDIPETWKWVRVQDIAVLNSGNQYTEMDTGIPYVKVADMNLEENVYEITTSSRFVSEDNNGCIPINSIIFPKRGGAIATNKKRVVRKMPVYVDSNTMGMTVISEGVFEYLKLCFDSIDLGKLQSGSSVPQINNKDIYPLLVPLPPLEEQHRIVAKIGELLPYVDRYAEAYEKLEQFNAKFPEDMKKSILQYAIQGKLVEQRPEEGTAEELYQQILDERQKLIKEGKIKKEKPLAEITEDEIPFDIPESWKWVRLGHCVTILGDGIHGTPIYTPNGEYYFINGNNLSDGNIEIKTDTKTVSFEEYEKYKKELNDHTVFVSINGTIGNVAFYNEEKIILGKSACYFNLIDKEWKDFIYWIIKTDYFLKYAITNATGSTIKNVSLATMKSFPVPLPPLKEQRRIVAKIKELLPYCDRLVK